MTELMEVKVEVQMEQKSIPERKPKKGRKPWRKRMKNVVLSPLHLFQKVILRKKRNSRYNKKVKDVQEENNEDDIIRKAAVEIAKKRNLPCYFLFLGLEKSGKSTTISKLFNIQRPKLPQSAEESDTFTIYENSDVGDGLGLKIVDTPGFSGENVEKDARLTLALSSFLTKDLSNRIPTATFLVVPFEETLGNQSNFKNMLNTLVPLEKMMTDELHSNLVLLLTHSQKVEGSKSESEIADLISSYQTSVSEVFPDIKNPVHVIPIENMRYVRRANGNSNFVRYHDLIFESLRKFAMDREEHILHESVNWLSENSKRFSVPLRKANYPLINYLLSSEIKTQTIFQESYEPFFVLYHRDKNGSKNRKSTKEKNDSTKIKRFQTCIPIGSQLVLADKTITNIEDALVGDKLLSLNSSRPSVITKIRQTTFGKEESDKNAIHGTIYCSLKKQSEEDNDSGNERFIYKYEDGSFEMVNVAKANILEKGSTKTVYFIELDSPNGTFVFNGFLCFAKCEEK